MSGLKTDLLLHILCDYHTLTNLGRSSQFLIGNGAVPASDQPANAVLS